MNRRITSYNVCYTKLLRASGYLNTDIYVFSDYDVVIVRTQAPNNGYTGKAESGNYFTKAMPLFRKIVKE